MKVAKLFSDRFIIGFGAVILVTYLTIILTVTHLGQSKLKQSQINFLELKVAQYVNTFEFILSSANHYGADLKDDKAVKTFFANLHSGMSMEYGLGSSLINLQRWLDKFIIDSQLHGKSIFNRITLIDYDNKILADTHQKLPLPRSSLTLTESSQKQTMLLVVEGDYGITIQLHEVIFHQGKAVGLFVADLNMDLIIEQLSLQEDLDSPSRLQLTSANDKSLIIWNTLTDASDTIFNSLVVEDEHIFFKKPIQGINLYFNSWFKPVNDDLFTSASFILVISILSVPMMFGLFYLIRLDKSNSLLKTRIKLSSKEKQKLSEKNILLASEVTKRKRSETQLAFQASHDELTGLANRSVSYKYLKDSISQLSADSEILIMFMDLDNFKEINDTFGHAAGDDILKMTSHRLNQLVSENDLVARFGGDEFLVITELPKNTPNKGELASSILALFNKPFVINGHDFFTTISIGLSTFPIDGTDPDTLLKNADMALYRVKVSGRNDFSFYDSSLSHSLQRSLLLDKRLRIAISNNLIEMHYQPIVDLVTGKIIAAEALMRWTDEELGFVSPEEFISLAEKNGLIHQLGELALRQACENATVWQSISPIEIAVNFSSVQFRYCDELFEQISTILKETKLPPHKLTIEITESLLVDNHNGLYEMLNKVEALGIDLSIDDFGTGYSALSYLQKLPFAKLKIDKAFIDCLQTNVSDRSLVKAIIAMSRALNLKVVAEGIEDSYQAKYLTDLHCEYGQGYLFNKAVSAKAFKQLLIDDKSYKA